MPANVLDGIQRFMLYSLKVHIKPWFNTQNAVKAPNSDLRTLKQIQMIQEIIPITAEAALNKMRNHLWYLSTKLIPLALFDDDVPIPTKIKMVHNLNTVENDQINLNRMILHQGAKIASLSLENFISKESRRFFEITRINSDFLLKHPSLWSEDNNYIHGLNIAKNLSVVNDSAERSIALYQNCKDHVKKEDQKKCLLQVTESERQKFKKLRKLDIVNSLH